MRVPPPMPVNLASRCDLTADYVHCAQHVTMISGRSVYYELPMGTPPARGWPIAFMFSGSFASADYAFYARSSDPFGAYYQALATKRLLDAGFAVIAPSTHFGGRTFWDTNDPLFAADWRRSPDDAFMRVIFAAIDQGELGPLDAAREYACGVSSGGYMASRMGVTYPARFHAIAIQSASYATCSGPLCYPPSPLPADHPPTLFLHGARDLVVPIETMTRYRDALERAGRPTQTIVDPSAGHGWISAAPDAIVAWFSAWP